MLNEKCGACKGTKVISEEESIRKQVEGEESPKVTISVTFEGKTNEFTGDFALIVMLEDNVADEDCPEGARAMSGTMESVGKIGIHMMEPLAEMTNEALRKTHKTIMKSQVSDILSRILGKGDNNGDN